MKRPLLFRLFALTDHMAWRSFWNAADYLAALLIGLSFGWGWPSMAHYGSYMLGRIVGIWLAEKHDEHMAALYADLEALKESLE